MTKIVGASPKELAVLTKIVNSYSALKKLWKIKTGRLYRFPEITSLIMSRLQKPSPGR
jgi:hypothetical protein